MFIGPQNLTFFSILLYQFFKKKDMPSLTHVKLAENGFKQI